MKTSLEQFLVIIESDLHRGVYSLQSLILLKKSRNVEQVAKHLGLTGATNPVELANKYVSKYYCRLSCFHMDRVEYLYHLGCNEANYQTIFLLFVYACSHYSERDTKHSHNLSRGAEHFYIKMFSRGVVASRDLARVKYFLDCGYSHNPGRGTGKFDRDAGFYEAVECGGLEIVKFLIGSVDVDYGQLLRAAAQSVDLDVAEFITEFAAAAGYRYTGHHLNNGLHCSAWNGNAEMMKFLLRQCELTRYSHNPGGGTNPEYSKYINYSFGIAAEQGHMKVVEILEPVTTNLARGLCGPLDIVRFVLDCATRRNYEFTPKYIDQAIAHAIANNHRDVVTLLLPRATCLESSLRNSACNGDIEMAELFIERVKITSIDFDELLGLAAKNGHLDMVRLMIAHGACRFVDARAYARGDGQTAVVEFLNAYV